MSAIFLSHSSKDDQIAGLVRARLDGSGYRSVFLDFDPVNGIPGGRNWERELYSMLRQCRAVVVLCSQHSMTSRWCFAEITHARALGKYVIPIRIDDAGLDSLLADTQVIDARKDWDDACARLDVALKKAGLDAAYTFEWDPRRPPYPGLAALQEADAAVFFGRDVETRDALDVLNKLRRFGGARFVVVGGPSGNGKSSLVRAGIVPRLKLDPESWLPLAPFRPRDNPVDELSMVLADGLSTAGERRPWRSLREDIERSGGAALATACETLRRAARRRDATVLLIIDQLEEALGGPSLALGEAFLSVIRAAMSREACPFMALATLRSEYFDDLVSHPSLRDLAMETISVRPMGVDGFAQVVRGPANVAGVSLEDGLVDLIARDTQTAEALPLLAFTLRELYERYAADGLITVDEYRTGLGGLEGAVARAAESVFVAARSSQDFDEVALRAALVAMARIDDAGHFVRRSVLWRNLPATVRSVLERFQAARLVVTRDLNGERIVEVAHEALFRSWDRMAQWLAEEREFLQWRQQMSHFVSEWERREHDAGTLLRGGLLLAAERWLTERPDRLDATETQLIVTSRTDQHRREEEWRRLYETAEAQRRAADARRLASQAALLFAKSPDSLQASVLVAIESVRRGPSLESDEVLRAGMDLLPLPGRRWSHHGMVTRVRFSDDVSHMAWCGGNDAHVQQMEGQGSLTLPHPSVVEDVAFSPDGRQVATACWDGHARMWELATRREVARLPHRGAPDVQVRQTVFSYDGQYLATCVEADPLAREEADNGRLVTVWNVSSGQAAYEFAHDAAVTGLAFSRVKNVLASGSRDGTVRLWDVAAGTQAARFDCGSPVETVVFSRDGSLIASSSEDGTIRLWDSTTAMEARRMFHRDGARVCAFSPDGRFLATGGNDRMARVWSSADGREIVSMAEGDHIFDLAFSPDAQWLATTTGGCSARVWSVESGIEIARAVHEAAVNVVAFTPDGRYLATGSGHIHNEYLVDCGVALWALQSADSDVVWPLSGAPAFSSDGRYFAFAMARRSDVAPLFRERDTIAIWDLANRQEQSRLHVPDPVDDYAFSPRNSIVATVGMHRLRLWAIETGQVVHEFTIGPSRQRTVLAVSPDGRRVAVGADAIQVFDLDARASVGSMTHGDPVRRLGFDSTGSQMFSIGGDSAIVWDVNELTAKSSMRHDGPLYDAAFSPDGGVLAVFGLDSAIHLWDAVNGRELMTLPHKDIVRHVTWQPGGSLLASAGNDGVRVWRVPDSSPVAVPVLNVPPRGLGFSPDGACLIVGLNDQTVRVFDTARWKEVARITHRSELSDLAISPDGCRIAATADGELVLWLWKREDVLAAALRRLTRNLTAAEWSQHFPDEPYAKICTHLPVHETVLVRALDLMNDGHPADARALLERVVAIDDDEAGAVASKLIGKLDRGASSERSETSAADGQA